MTLPDNYLLRTLRMQSHQLLHEVGLLAPDVVLWKPAPAEWSAQECLTHLRDTERNVFLVRIERMVNEDNPALVLFDEAAHHAEHWTPDEPIQNILADFVADRGAEVALLEKADWSRPGIHPVRGPITLGWLANYTLGHTWEHLSQMMRARLAYDTRK
jgi:hypothetical protein